MVSRTAADTRPTLVVTFSDITRVPFSSPARDCTTMPCGGTEMPESVPPSTGPLSVRIWTDASAGWLSVFIRYSRMSPTGRCPGPTNQKSVPGPWHCAVPIPLALVCSASSPRAREPLARIITPPRAGTVVTEVLAAPDAPVAPRASGWATGTFTSASWPGWASAFSGVGATAAPAGDRRLTSAFPLPVDAAATATPDAVGPGEPGAGQARTAADTVALAATGALGPATVAGC